MKFHQAYLYRLAKNKGDIAADQFEEMLHNRMKRVFQTAVTFELISQKDITQIHLWEKPGPFSYSLLVDRLCIFQKDLSMARIGIITGIIPTKRKPGHNTIGVKAIGVKEDDNKIQWIDPDETLLVAVENKTINMDHGLVQGFIEACGFSTEPILDTSVVDYPVEAYHLAAKMYVAGLRKSVALINQHL